MNMPEIDVNAHPGFETLSLAELEEYEFPDVTWLVEDLMPAGALVLLVGRPKAGKSLLAIDLLASVATGTSFLGRPAESGATLYLPAEDALSLVRDRLFMRMGDNREAPLAVIPADGSFDQTIEIDTRESVVRLAETVARHRSTLLVLDPFRELHRQPENEAQPMASVLRPMRQLAHMTHCTVVLIHHRNKHATDPSLAIRGSSAIAGGVDVTITLDTVAGVGDYSDSQLLMLNVEGRYGTRQQLAARLGDNLRWEQVDDYESGAHSATDRVLSLLQSSAATMTADQIAMETGLAKKTIQNAFGFLRGSSLIERLGSGTRYDPYRYRAARDEPPEPRAAPAEQPKFDPF